MEARPGGRKLSHLEALSWMEGRLSANSESDYMVSVPSSGTDDVYHGRTPREAVETAWREFRRKGREAISKLRSLATECGLICDVEYASDETHAITPVAGAEFHFHKTRKPRPRKYVPGDRVWTLVELVAELRPGRYLIVNGKTMHPAVLMNWTIETLLGALRRGSIRKALPNPEHPGMKEVP